MRNVRYRYSDAARVPLSDPPIEQRQGAAEAG